MHPEQDHPSSKSNNSQQTTGVPSKFIRRSPYHPHFYQTGIDSQILKKSATQSPIDQIDYPLTTHAIFESPPKAKYSSYAVTNGNGLSSQLQIKLLQQQQQMSNGRKESIQQVIKDCFITKKLGQQDSTSTNTNKYITPQKQKKGYIYQHVEGQRMHSMNQFKSFAQGQNPIQFIKKGSKETKIPSQDEYADTPESKPLDDSASSLFMRYVKSKLVKKIKTESLPQQVANKYIDIYKELIDKEAQRKQEEQEFMQQQKQIGITQSRNKQQARSEQKSRHKAKTRPIDEPRHYKTQTQERKSMDEPLSYQMMTGSAPYQIMINGNQSAFSKKNPNRSVYLMEDNSYLEAPDFSQNTQDNSKVRFPIINNFSSTIDYKKKSRDIINEQKNAYNQAAINVTTNGKGISILQPPQGAGYAQFKHEQPYQYQRETSSVIDEARKTGGKISIDSSIDEEMLDKIKNIYTEMRKNTHTNAYQLNQIYTQKSSAKMGSLRQKRLLMKGPAPSQNAEAGNVGDNYQGPKGDARNKINQNTRIAQQQYIGIGINLNGQQSKSLNQSMNPPSFSERK